MGFCVQPVHNKVISGFRAIRQARAPVVGVEPATEGSLRIRYPLCHRRPEIIDKPLTQDQAVKLGSLRRFDKSQPRWCAFAPKTLIVFPNMHSLTCELLPPLCSPPN
ncbi:hypothetical protein PoB_002347000 [Plakobranchus ocellatus]|uniref:Uncharacterized protein n=1 Tax=Plakobranchus ocellatus TaxID=259542 RepID=A0AAV3ZMQ5_9GAST|nr:hypothetical protein PoB_002347000 [Plakobranchus ocellatus]